MKRLTFIFIAALLSLGNANAESFDIVEGSTLRYHVSHPMHDVTGVGDAITMLEKASYDPNQPTDFSGIQNIPIQAAWASFDSGNNNRDANTLLVVKASQYPKITYVIETIAAAKPMAEGLYQATSKGRMYIAGQKNPVTAALTIDVSDPQKLNVKADTKIDMTKFGIDPPKLLLISADKLVRIEADLWLSPTATTTTDQ